MMSAIDGGLHRSAQHFILNGNDGVYVAESKKTVSIHGSGEDGAVGSLAASGIIECDWASI